MPRRSTPPVVALWPLWAVLLLVAHGVLLGFLFSRPGRVAIVPFVVGPKILAGLTAVVVAMAGFDVLHSGWRRLLRARTLFDMLAIATSIFLTLFVYRAYPSSYDDRPSELCLSFPIEGDVAVMQGGRTIDVNYHAGSPAQRYAYDLAIAEDGATHRGEGYVVWDYYAYGKPVVAPVSGTVVTAVDGEVDQSPSAVGWRPWRSAGGNFVVLQIDAGQYLFLAHLQPGSIAVQPGEDITAGTPIGRVGNSGRSGAPHLHMHLQDTPEANAGEGIPIAFCGYDAIGWGSSWNTARYTEHGIPTGRVRRQVIRAAPPRE